MRRLLLLLIACAQPGPALAPGEDFAGLAELPCARQVACAEPLHLGDTCCAWGDALVSEGQLSGHETVDVETDGRWVVACGGFGAAISSATSGRLVGSVTERCQRAAFGTDTDTGRVLYLAHHGDSWVPTPHLTTVRLDATDALLESILEEPDVLYEGMAWRDDRLYVATHAGGLRTYATDDRGLPTHLATLTGFDNAKKVALGPAHAYVSDTERITVVDLSDPDAPALLGFVPTAGEPRDLDRVGDRLYVALGNDGVQSFDLSDPAVPAPLVHVDHGGSAQGVAANADRVALANWDHAAVLDPETLALLATERVEPYPGFEQDLGIALDEDLLFVGEWLGTHVVRHRPGYVAPDIWVREELLGFDGDVAGTQTLHVSNRGPLSLELRVRSEDTWLSTSGVTWLLAPGEEVEVPVAYDPPARTDTSLLELRSNDPDQVPLLVPVHTLDSDLLDVGDTLPDAFGFLDPTGAGDVDNLRGQVWLLAYFALF
jgi:hypothetical protein